MSVTMLNEGREVSTGAPPSRRTGYDSPFVANRGHWNKVFTDQEYFDSIAKQKGIAEAANVSPFGDDYVYRQAMIGYMADTRKVPLEDMRAIYDAEKDSFAKKMLGKQTITSKELFDWHKNKFEQENEKEAAARQVLNNVIKRSVEDSLSGSDTPFVESVAKDIDAAGDMFSEEDKARLWEQAEAMDIKVRQANGAVAEDAKFIFETLRQQASGDQGVSPVDMNEMASRFAQLPDNQRKAVYEMVGAYSQVAQIDKGFWYQMAESLGRGGATFTERVPRNFKEQSLRGDLRLLSSEQPVFKAGDSYSAAGTTPITPEEREQAKADIQKELGVLKVERELRDLAERVVDPIKTVTFLPTIVEEGLYGAAQSIPYTAAAAVPFAGVPAVASALFSANYDQIMLDYPDIDPDKAALVAAISAPIEAGLERMKVNTIMGKLPIVGGLVKRLKHPNQRNLTRIAIGGAGVLAEQNTQETLQNAAFPLVQTIAAALDQDMPDYDWGKRLANMPRELAVQFVALLPLSLIGMGALSYREIQRGDAALRDKDAMLKMGMAEDAADRVLGAESAEEAQQIFRDEYAKRDPKAVKAAAKRVLDEAVALREQQAPAALPRIERQGGEYVVLTPEGTVITRSTDQGVAEQALVSARRDAVRREMQGVTTGITEAVAFIQKVNEARQRGEDIAEVIREQAPRTLLTDYEANPTQENLDRLFETVRAFGQDINEPAELANFPVTGSNQGALREGIWRSIIRINEGADGTIVMREFAQDNLKRAIAEGRTTMDFVRQQLNDILPQIDSDRMERRLRTETDTDVIEAFSDIAVAYFRGSIREEQIPAGLRGIMRRLAIMTRDIFRRAYNLARLRAEGKLDRDFEALLAEAVGVNQQALVDRARERTEQEVGATQNYSIAGSRARMSQFMEDSRFTATGMLADGKTSEEIRAVTGWFRHPFDGSLVWEIPDNNAQLKLRKGATRIVSFDGKRLGEVLDHPALYEAYPDLQNIVVYVNNRNRSTNVREAMDGASGKFFRPYTNQYNQERMPARIVLASDLSKSSALRVLMHEVQHAIQAKEGFPRGSNWREFARDGYSREEAMAAYRRTAGEIEARDVEARLNLTPEERQAVAPYSSSEIATGDKDRALVMYYGSSVENYSIGVRFDEIAKEDPKHDGSRVGTAWQGKVKPTTQDTNDGVATVTPKELEKQMAMLTHFVDGVPLPKYITKFRNAEKRMRAFIDFQKGNLLALYDAFESLSADYVIRSTHWYDGARLLAEGIRDRYNLTVEQSSAIMAVFSPMKDWFQNVAMGQRFADVMANHKDTPVNKSEMGEAMDEMLNAAADANYVRKAFSLIEGKSITDLLADKSKEGRKLAAVAVRLMSTHVHGLTHDVLSPEGESLGIRKNLDGSNKKMVWQSYAFIEKAISIYEDSSLENISKTLGTEHKIRNFYNNIVAPTSPYGDATVDTHAVNAAVLYPMGGSAYLTTLNFGSAGVAGGGNSGIYWLFHEALREAAAERGVMPRQMQSITWEAIRGLFTDVRKRDKNFVATITKIWEDSTDANAARTQIIGLGITPPEWARVGGSDSGVEGGVGEPAGQIADTAGSVRSGVRQGRQGGNQGTGVGNYSISTQREIDRVQAAMGALDRSPLDRVKIYEKMQERFLRVMADNRETLSAMDGDLSQVRRTQILQALGELDGIISALPAEIRSKIGGYTQLAKVDPMDVFKGDQKVSEVRGMSGAIISAWMREGLNIGEAQKKTELPAGYRAERNLDPTRADRAIADVFIQRINRINEVLENFLRDEYNDAAVELFKRAKPQRSGAGEKPKGKLGADVHELFDTLKEATEWSAVKAAAEADKFIAMAESGELNPYEEAHAFLAAQVVPLFADWANADSSQRAAAVTMGKEILDRAYRGEQQRILAMRQKRGYDRTDLSDDAGVAAADDKARQEAVKRENSLPAKWEAGMLNLLNFDQVLSYIFGRDSKVATEIVNRQRKADNEKSDGIAKLSDEWAAFLTQLGGGETEGQRLMFDLSRMDDDIDGVPYSQNQLMAITMMWMQPKGRQHMEGFFDSDGNPSGNWHYNQEFVNKAEAKLRPEAKAIREYLLRKYDEEYDAINKVYRKVYGLNLPKNQFYSPLSVEPIKAPQGASVDPVTGAVFVAGANSPSALRSRGGAIAQPVFRDAVQTYFAHMLQMEHWKAYAQFNSEVTAILGHRDTRMVVKGKAGEQAATVLNNWLQYFLQGGNKDAANHLAINQWIGRMTSNFAAIALFGRLSTLALQTTQLGAASAKMPVGAYLSRFGKLMSGRLGWKAAIDSDYIQRRIKDMPPAVAIAMQGLRAEKPNAIRNAAKWLGQQLSGFDGLFTAGTYAIVYDYQLSQARQNGMGGKEAEDFAHAETERIVDEIAQPTRAGARSIYELNMTNPVARAVWAFSSESRKNMGLLMYNFAKGTNREYDKAIVYVMLLNGLVGILIRNAFRDMRDDDDEETFDEKNWGWSRMAAMFISDPIYGIPVVGETIESGVYAAFGVYKPSGPVFDVARGVPAAKRMLTQYPAEALEGDADFRDIVADVNRILATAGLFNSTIAGAASISNLVKDIYETGDNALGE